MPVHGANAYLPAAERYETVLVAAHRAPLRAANQMQLVADLSFDDAVGYFDILLVAGGPAMPDAPPDPALTAWLRKVPDIAGLYGAGCNGAFALGLRRPARPAPVTTHWQHAGKLSRRFPEARVESDAMDIRDDRLMTSAGVTAGHRPGPGIDRREPRARAGIGGCQAGWSLVAQRQGGQSQFSPYLTAPSDPGSPVARIQAFVMANIGQRHTLQSLAAAGLA